MNRSAKISAIVLLIALAISTALMVMVFVSGENDSAIGVKTLYDQKTKAPTLNNLPADMSLTKKTSLNGVEYYSIGYTEGWAVDAGGYTKEPFVQFIPGAHYIKDGWRNGDTSPGTDDTDYLVIDFDISTDTNRFDQLYFQTLFYYGKPEQQADGSYKAKRSSAQSGHYVLYGDSGEDAYFVATSDESTKLPIEVQSDDEWAHITMVVDTTADTARTMHLYYDGRFISSRVCMTDNATYLESVRISLGTSGVAPDLDNETFSLANATVKSFPKGYTGELAEEKANLGSVLYPLSSFADLGYCLEDLPESAVAKVTHSDTTEELVTKISDLDGNLTEGDTVTLYRDIARKIVVPGKLVGDSVVPAVSFELNGCSMVDPLALADYNELDFIVRDADGELYGYESNGVTVYGKGAQTYADGKLSVDSLDAFVKAAFPSGITGGKTLKFTFLKDTTISYSASLKHGASHVTYDLNGNKLTISGGKVPFQTSAAEARVVIRDGSLVNGTSNPLYMDKAANYYVVDVDITVNSSLCDQRAGILFFIDSTINANNTVTSIKSFSGKSAYAVFDGCEIAINGESPISFSNLRTSSARRGSMNNFVGVYNTTADGDSSLIHVNYYANEWEAGDEAALENKNNVFISIQGSSITTLGANPAILAEVQSLTNLTDGNSDFADGFSAVTEVYVDSSDINADTLLTQSDNTAERTLTSNNISAGEYSASANITLKRSRINSGEYVFSNDVGTGSENGSLIATLCDFVRFTNVKWAKDGDSDVKVEFAEGVKLAYAYDLAYPYVATLNWSEDTLVGERPEVTTVKLSPIFADGMVLQGNKEINIYGTCSTIGAEIEVKIGDNVAKTTVKGDCSWSVTLPPMEYQKGVTIIINELGVRLPETKIENVNIGEIWMMSGQSNSVYGVYKMEDFAEYRSNADNFDNIYAFSINQGQSLIERNETNNSGWYKVTSSTLTKDDRYTGISAVAYVMATRLATELGEDVTVGIIDVNFNGSTVEAWMSPESLAEVDPELSEKYNAYRDFYLATGVYPTEGDVSEYGTYIKSDKLYQKMPCACYNAMLYPFFNGFSIRGAIWYQGEGNASSVTADSDGNYRKHFTGVRSTFRDVFADEELPVFIIQIPPRVGNPFYFRALQYDLADKDENTYVVMSLYAGSTYSSNELKYTDPGESMVHYERKTPVGLALADSVLENVYSLGTGSAPKILSVVKADGAIVITFDRELTVDMGSEMLGFEIAGADKLWVNAKAAYNDKVVTLTADGVAEPEMVRYGADKSILVMEDGSVLYHNKEDAKFTYDETAGIVTITANGVVYVIEASDPAVIGGRMNCNVVATNGTALPIFLAVGE
ncbi:MAG: hypothetical protein IKC32_04285 [Clostridia bacterium]|nr:hypothetical protein [Clostridia bacterium]